MSTRTDGTFCAVCYLDDDVGLADGLGHERGDVIGVLALDEVGRHLAVAAGAPVVDRVEHEVLGRPQVVEVGPDLGDRVGGLQRVAVAAALAEQLTPVLLRRREVARRWRRGCRCGRRRWRSPRRGSPNPRITSASTKLTSASRRVPRLCDASRARAPLGAAAHGDEQDAQREPHEDEHEDERGPHGAADYLFSAVGPRRRTGRRAPRCGSRPSRPPPPPAARAPRARRPRRRPWGAFSGSRSSTKTLIAPPAIGSFSSRPEAISSGSERTSRRWRS